MSELFPGISDTGMVAMRYFYIIIFLAMFTAFISLIFLGALGGVRGKGAKWSEYFFYNVWILTVIIWLASGPPLLWRSFNIGLAKSIPEAGQTYAIMDELFSGNYTVPYTTTVDIPPLLPPTPVPAMTVASTAEPTAQPTATIPNIMLPAVTITPSPVPTLDPAQWNPMTPPPTRSQ